MLTPLQMLPGLTCRRARRRARTTSRWPAPAGLPNCSNGARGGLRLATHGEATLRPRTRADTTRMRRQMEGLHEEATSPVYFQVMPETLIYHRHRAYPEFQHCRVLHPKAPSPRTTPTANPSVSPNSPAVRTRQTPSGQMDLPSRDPKTTESPSRCSTSLCRSEAGTTYLNRRVGK